jgi:hypothetical protein
LSRPNSCETYPREVERCVQQAIESDYPERKSIQDALDRAIILVKRENDLRPADMQLPQPTRRLVTRMIDAIPAFDRHAARYGHTSAVMKFSGRLAHTRRPWSFAAQREAPGVQRPTIDRPCVRLAPTRPEGSGGSVLASTALFVVLGGLSREATAKCRRAATKHLIRPESGRPRSVTVGVLCSRRDGSRSRRIARFRSFLTLVLSGLFDALLRRVYDWPAHSQDQQHGAGEKLGTG